MQVPGAQRGTDAPRKPYSPSPHTSAVAARAASTALRVPPKAPLPDGKIPVATTSSGHRGPDNTLSAPSTPKPLATAGTANISHSQTAAVASAAPQGAAQASPMPSDIRPTPKTKLDSAVEVMQLQKSSRLSQKIDTE